MQPEAAAALDVAVESRAEEHFDLLERMVSQASTVGREHGALEVFAEALAAAGLDVERVPIRPDVAADSLAGIPQVSYDDRFNVVGRRGGSGRSLLLNGHIDVVPPGDERSWATPPFVPTRRDGWLIGRGAGDMKCGFAMGLLAIRALDACLPEAIAGPLTFLGVIEEECTGNGALSACRDGILADAAVLLEPTDLGILVGGIGILWLDIDVPGHAAHAESADRSVNPVDACFTLIQALRQLESDINDAAASDSAEHGSVSFNLNVGVVHAGDWPSSVPASALMRVRFGFPASWSIEEAEQRLRDTVTSASARDAFLATHPPTVTLSGFRARGYRLDPAHPLVRAMSSAHESAHASPPEIYSLGSTTDARFYINDFDVPAICYGPVARDIHGTNERVELESIVRGAKTLARFIAGWYA